MADSEMISASNSRHRHEMQSSRCVPVLPCGEGRNRYGVHAWAQAPPPATIPFENGGPRCADRLIQGKDLTALGVLRDLPQLRLIAPLELRLDRCRRRKDLSGVQGVGFFRRLSRLRRPARDHERALRMCSACGAYLSIALFFTALLHTNLVEAQTLWFNNGELSAQGLAVAQTLRSAESYGLRSESYALAIPPSDLARVLAGERVDERTRIRFDAALSASATTFLRDLHYGRVSAQAAGFHLPEARAAFDARAAIRALAISRDVSSTIASYEPRPIPYRRLKEMLQRYRALAARGDLRAPPPSRVSIKEGDRYEGLPQLRRLLAALGDLEDQSAADPTTESLFDATTAEAVRRFQRRHGLEVDGVLGRRTFAALAVPLERRVRQIELTLERWRWTASLARPDIVVNVPQFMLFALPREGAVETSVLEMPVIVGQRYPHMRTPVFVAAIEYVIFQPFWDVPASITQRELLPLIREDPSYLALHDMEIVGGFGDDAKPLPPTPDVLARLARGDVRLRQRPGAGNALGSVKFVMPNPYNVYLHATPNIELFEHAQRTFSHGCIRVSEPALLAGYVLQNAAEDWTAESIQAALCDSTTRRVTLEKPVSVLIFYGTAAASESVGDMFFEDIYGHDARLEQLLNR